MEYTMGFGTKPQKVVIPDQTAVEVLLPNHPDHYPDEGAELEKALDSPIGTERLEELVKPGDRIVIVTSDMTRPMPTGRVLPHILTRLESAGVSPDQVTVVFALGSHRNHTREEKRQLLGAKYRDTLSCMDSGQNGFVHLGTTSFGTPVDIDKTVAEADVRICLGNIEYHYFAGYSGGAKAIMPGVSTRQAIQANHRMMVNEKAAVGLIDDNPVRQDLEEAIKLCPIHFLLNLILSENKQILRAFAGDYIQAHREGCFALDGFYRRHIAKKADIVIVSQGGAPKDLNLYQTQKALDNAQLAVRQGGIIILVGACQEGMGEPHFEEWMTQADTPEKLIERVSKEFVLGGHKAAAIAMTLRRAEIFLVSEMDENLVRNIFMTPFSTLQQALEAALQKIGQDALVLLMPYGGSTLPVLDRFAGPAQSR